GGELYCDSFLRCGCARPDDSPPQNPSSRMAAPMKASVVINTYNKGATLECVLEALERQEGIDPRCFEVVVRDDGSTDDTWARLERLVPRWAGRLRISRGENTGVSEARNIG